MVLSVLTLNSCSLIAEYTIKCLPEVHHPTCRPCGYAELENHSSGNQSLDDRKTVR